MALTGSEQMRLQRQSLLARCRSQLEALLGNAEQPLMQRLAGTVFLIRVVAAGLAYGSQVLFARWMGSFEFGIYVYVWTWVLLLGQSLDFGLATAAQRFIPEYRERQLFNLLRGFVSSSRWLGLGIGFVVAAIGAGVVRLLQPWLDDYTVIPLYLGCIALPAYGLGNIQDGISRSYDWVGLGLMPVYIVRQLLLTVLMAGAYFGGFPLDAVTAMVLACVAIWLPTLGQHLVLRRRLRHHITPGPKQHEVKFWLQTALPIMLAESFYLMLAHTDVLILKQFRPPDDVAIYYAAAKTMALVSFIHFAIGATAAHRFSSYYAAGNRLGLAVFLGQAVRWTLWPSLATALLLLAFGWPLLRLFGAQFTSGYALMFVLAVGLLARAAFGPMERLLNVLGQQRATASVCASALAINIGLCVVLIPHLGTMGAAIATSVALVVESVSLFVVAKRCLGFRISMRGGVVMH